MRLKHTRITNNLKEEVECLEQENRKLRKKLGISDDEDVINLDDDSESDS